MSFPNQYFQIKLSLSSGGNQAEIMQLLRSQGADVIQTNDGLCVRADKSLEELRDVLKEKGLDSGLTVAPLDPRELDESAPQDLKAFTHQA